MTEEISLERILADKRTRLGQAGPPRSSGSNPGPDGDRFIGSLRQPGTRIIAEIKARSPSAGVLLPDADGRIETIALAYRRGHAAALSVVVEQDHFGGNPDWLPRARRISGLPTLMKDFIVEMGQLDEAVELGADAVLLIVRALSSRGLEGLREAARARGLAVVIEAHDGEEIALAAAADPDVLGVNARDLMSFETDLSRLEGLAPLIPRGPVRLAESGIRSQADVERLAAAGFDAFLVGEALLRAEDPEEALRNLRA